MPDFAAIFDKILPTSDMPDAVFSISQDSINNLLSAHRLHDAGLYYRKEELRNTISKQPFFSMEVLVGAKKDTPIRKAKPLVLKLYDSKQDVTQALSGNRLVYTYAAKSEARAIGINLDPNVVIGASDINFYLEWPNSSGGAWKEHIKDVAFTLEAYLDIEQIDGSAEGDAAEVAQAALKIVPISLFVGQEDFARVYQAIEEKMLDDGGNALTAGRVSDLIVSLFAFAATKIGPDLIQTIHLPMAQVSGHDVYPSFMKIKDATVSIGAHLRPSEEKLNELATIKGQIDHYQWLLEQDVAAAGGWDKLLYTDESLIAYHDTPAHLRHAATKKLEMRSEADIEFFLRASNAFSKQLIADIESRNELRIAGTPVKQSLSVSKVKDGLAVAINEYFFDQVVADFGNANDADRTKTLRVLDSIKGYLNYRYSVGIPDIKVSNKISGSVATDAWAGLTYAYREYHRCSTSWSSWKNIGVGIKGKPKLSLKTISSSGVSFLAKFNFGSLRLYTGQKVVDALLKPLSKLFIKPFELFLNALSVLLSFVVLPAKFSPKNMNTALSISRVSMSNYKRSGGPTDTTNNYLLIVADTEATKQ
ncbi:MAG: hypothetical protein ACFE0K_15525 [Alcanivorax sp.]|uniref:hypothetical protein n=1 Tax=Alcanivorax sp. TaxID=1872427 RepID=UPI003DA77EEC